MPPQDVARFPVEKHIEPLAQPHPWLDVSLVALGASVLLSSSAAAVMWSTGKQLEAPCVGASCPQSERNRVERYQTATQLTNAGLALTALTGACSFVLWQWGDLRTSQSVALLPGGLQYSRQF
jgi:hypothetical protein